MIHAISLEYYNKLYQPTKPFYATSSVHRAQIDEAEVAGAQSEDLASEVREVAAHMRKNRGRWPISPDYPRVEEVHDIPDEDKVCACDCQMTRIGL